MFSFGEFTFNPHQNQLNSVGEPVVLRQKIAELLNYFLLNPERIISKEELLKELWVHGEYRERALSQSILELRKALGDSANQPEFIKTIPGKGYQWIKAVEEHAPSPAANIDEPQHTHSRKRIHTLALITGVVALIASIFHLLTSEPEFPDTPTIAVMPFTNDTQLSSMQWVEYGLSDMLTTDLTAIPDVTVLGPANISRLLTTSHTEIKQSQLEALMKDQQIDYLIQADVSTSDQQILRYKIHSADNAPIEGSLSHPDLAVAMPKIAQQLFDQIAPEEPHLDLSEYPYRPSAMHDYARGIQALQQSGPKLARHYFSASYLLDNSNLWSLTYVGITEIYLGFWQSARQHLEEAEHKADNSALVALTQHWQGELAVRENDSERAREHFQQSLGLATESNNRQLMARNYQKLANLAARESNWQRFHQDHNKAKALYPLQLDTLYEARQRHPAQLTIASPLQASINPPLRATTADSVARINYLQAKAASLRDSGEDAEALLQETVSLMTQLGLAVETHQLQLRLVKNLINQQKLSEASRLLTVIQHKISATPSLQSQHYILQQVLILKGFKPKTLSSPPAAVTTQAESIQLQLIFAWQQLKEESDLQTNLDELYVQANQLGLDTLAGYINQTRMYQALIDNNPTDARELAPSQPRTRLEYIYLAVAQQQLGEKNSAIATLTQMRHARPELLDYRYSDPLPTPYEVITESGWLR